MKKLLFILLMLSSFMSFAQADTSKTTADFLNNVDKQEVPDSFAHKFDATGGREVYVNDSLHQVVFWYTFTQNKKVFEWQYTSSIIIFLLVLLIVILGLYMSYLQFRLATKMLTKPRKGNSESGEPDYTELIKADMQLGKDGIKINTAVVGLIILTLSLAFLFLYLKYVYPISIVKVA